MPEFHTWLEKEAKCWFDPRWPRAGVEISNGPVVNDELWERLNLIYARLNRNVKQMDIFFTLLFAQYTSRERLKVVLLNGIVL